MTKICRDCKWAINKDLSGGSLMKCICPKNTVKSNKVTGEIMRTWNYCSSHREASPFLIDILLGVCGNRGRWFKKEENK